MPLYDYICSSCEKKEERFVLADERHKQKCACGGDLKLQISAPQLSIFQPMVLHDLDTEPICVESKAQLKEECEKRGVSLERFREPKPKGEHFV